MGLFNKHKKTTSAVKKEQKAKLSDYLAEKNIIFFNAGPSKRQVLGSLIASLDLSDPNAALQAILQREEKGSTLIAPALALPHARISGLTKIAAALAICPEGVVDPLAGHAVVKVFLLFLGPAEDMSLHLAFLANVSALFQNDAFRETLLGLTKPSDVLKKIQETEKKLV